MEVAKIFAERAEKRRKELGLTQEALAKRMDVSRGTVAGYLQGDTAPGSKVLLSWAKALETTPEWLLGQDQPQPAVKTFYQSAAKPIQPAPGPSEAELDALVGMAGAVGLSDDVKKAMRLLFAADPATLSNVIRDLERGLSGATAAGKKSKPSTGA